MAYKTIWKSRGVIWKFTGSLTDKDLLGCNRELYSDSRFPTIDYEICDFSSVETFPIKTETIKTVGYMDVDAYNKNPNMKVAIVANNDVMKGLTSVYNAYISSGGVSSPWETKYFESVEEANVWVNEVNDF